VCASRRVFLGVVGCRLLLLSYILLLRGIAGTVVEEGMTALDHLLDQLPSGEAHACLWPESAGHVSPVLVLEQAKVIADHPPTSKAWRCATSSPDGGGSSAVKSLVLGNSSP
jgi:hypothetical protein